MRELCEGLRQRICVCWIIFEWEGVFSLNSCCSFIGGNGNIEICEHISRLLRNEGIILIMNDDDVTSHFMIQSSQQVWSATELPNLSESSLVGGL